MKTLSIVFFLATTMSIFIFSGCGDDDELGVVPTVVTGDVTNITSTTADCIGTITSIGSSGITASGIQYTANGAECSQGGGALFSGEFTVTIGNFPSSWCDLEPDTEYSYQAFAENSAGKGYGEKRYFKTSP